MWYHDVVAERRFLGQSARFARLLKVRRLISEQRDAGSYRRRRSSATAIDTNVVVRAVEPDPKPNHAATWLRVDLHLHTPASTDYQQPGVSALDILRAAEERGLDIIAFTDHNSVRGYADLWREIEDLELLEGLNRLNPAEATRLAEFRRLLGKVLLLPGFEFTATFGFHILAIFPETTSIRLMEHLLLSLGVPEERFGSGEVGATSDTLRAYEVLADHGALVFGAHVNSSHGVAMQGMRFGGQTKIAYTQDEHLHALEVTDLDSTSRRSTAAFFSGIKAEYPRRMHCIQGSDAHRLDRDPARETNLGVGDRATEVFVPNASFAALKALFASSNFDNVRPANPGGPAADALHEARQHGNTASQSFHERLSQARAGSAPILKDVVALANGSGGSVYIGVGPADRKTIAGVPDAESAIANLAKAIELEITPRVDVSSEVVKYSGKSVIALHIPDGSEKPYALAPASILVRPVDETRVATRDEIVAMVRGLHRQVEVAKTQPVLEQTRPIDSAPSTTSESRRNGRQPGRTSRRTSEEPGTAPPVTVPPAARTATSSETASVQAERAHEYQVVEGAFDPIAPRSGAEIVDVTVRDGITHYSIRDLRNGSIAHNVTRENARRLWQYAIQQHEERAVDAGHVRWKGDLGFWKVYRPSRGERRFNLAYRGQGTFRIFYGVSEDGMDDRWRVVIPAARATTA